jgi:hypothetical protein
MIPPANQAAAPTPRKQGAVPVKVFAGDDIELSEDVDFEYDPEIEPRWLDRLRPRGMRSHKFESEI